MSTTAEIRRRTVEPALTDIVQELARFREKYSIPAQAIADRCGFSRVFVSGVLSGRRNARLDDVLVIAQAMGFQTDIRATFEVGLTAPQCPPDGLARPRRRAPGGQFITSTAGQVPPVRVILAYP